MQTVIAHRGSEFVSEQSGTRRFDRHPAFSSPCARLGMPLRREHAFRPGLGAEALGGAPASKSPDTTTRTIRPAPRVAQPVRRGHPGRTGDDLRDPSGDLRIRHGDPAFRIHVNVLGCQFGQGRRKIVFGHVSLLRTSELLTDPRSGSGRPASWVGRSSARSSVRPTRRCCRYRTSPVEVVAAVCASSFGIRAQGFSGADETYIADTGRGRLCRLRHILPGDLISTPAWQRPVMRS